MATRDLPLGVTQSKTASWFRYKRGRNSKPHYFGYGKDTEAAAKQKVLAFAKKMNAIIGPTPLPASTKGRMNSRNSSGVVGVQFDPYEVIKPNGNAYYYERWLARWPGCKSKGGVPWQVNEKCGDNKAFVLAVLCRRMETELRYRVVEAFEKIEGTEEYKSILKLKKQSSKK